MSDELARFLSFLAGFIDVAVPVVLIVAILVWRKFTGRDD